MYNYHNSGHYPSSCILFKTQLNSVGLSVPHRNTLRLRYEPNRLMLSIGLWRWYINVTITILDIVHRPVFYSKYNSTLLVCPYLTGNTLRLRHEPNRLMLSIGLWRWYIKVTIAILDIIHRRVFYLRRNDTETGICLCLQAEPTQLDPINGTIYMHIYIYIYISKK
jgi:hypothetical protein